MALTVKIKVGTLLQHLRENRAKHRAIFLEALEGYRKKCLEVLNEKIEKIKNGKGLVAIAFMVPQPEDHTEDYNRAIRMLEMSETPVIEINEQDFSAYVMDKWGWQRGFLSSNSRYSETAMAILDQEGDRIEEL